MPIRDMKIPNNHESTMKKQMIMAVISVMLITMATVADGKVICKEELPKPKIVYKTVTVKEQVKEPMKAMADADATATGQATATTGQQVITINMPQPTKERVRTIKRTIYKTRKVTVIKNVTDPNRLLLMVGQSKTKMKVEFDDCCNIKAKREYEPDFGLQYLRDFSGVTGSIMGTTNKNYYLGVGINW